MELFNTSLLITTKTKTNNYSTYICKLGQNGKNRTYGAMTNITHGMQGITYNVKFAFKGMSMTKHSQVQNISAYSEYTKTAINLFQILNNFLVNHILYITYTRFEQLRHIIFQRHKNNQTTNKQSENQILSMGQK